MARALIAMSGGVDSAVAAYLLKAQGYDCLGVTMRLFLNGDVGLDPRRPCCSQRDVDDAASVCRAIGIPHEALNCMVDFKLEVIDRFIAAYDEGRTPNPCIDCNRYVKFGTLLDLARERGFDFLATGHYARIERGGDRWLLRKGVDPERDQSYVLYALTQEQIARTLFPLGGMTKPEVRALAASLGFVNARKRDSQDICFVPDGDYARFIERYTGRTYPPGDFLDGDSNTILGRHEGIIRYTIGQRRGLGVPARGRLYVQALDAGANTVTLSARRPECRSVTAKGVNLISVASIEAPLRVGARVRYRQREAAGTATQPDRDTLRVTFDEPQPLPAPGQALVIYDGDLVVGGGTLA